MPAESDSENEPNLEKRVTWAELFFDPVFVFAVAQVSALVYQDPYGLGWAGP